MTPAIHPDFDPLDAPAPADCGLNTTASFADLFGPPPEAENDNDPSVIAEARLAHEVAAGAPALSVIGRSFPEPSGSGKQRRRPEEIDWRERSVVGDLRRSTCIPLPAYDEAHGAWSLCRDSFRDVNTLVTIKPYAFDALDPFERHQRWEWYRNKLQVACRQLGFAFTAILVRESANRRGEGEHCHVLMWVPPEHREAFDRVIGGWSRHKKKPADIDVRRAHGGVSYTRTGKRRSAIGYITKNASPQARRRDGGLWWKTGGAIWGWRCKTTLNIGAKAQAAHHVSVEAGSIRPALARAA